MLYAVAGALVVVGLVVRWRLSVPVRRFEGSASVSGLYDRWTRERVLEFYWSEHLHAGFYGDPPVRKDFIEAKIDLIDELVKWGLAEPFPDVLARLEPPESVTGADPVRILDVGCGIGGSTRHLARRWRQSAHVTGLTISRNQAERATHLARAQKVDNAAFFQCDALALAIPDESIDVVWAVESEPHILDKERYFREMARVLKPGGTLVLATWNVRDTRGAPLSSAERKHVQYLLDEWCHAEFSSIPECVDLLGACGLVNVESGDWTAETLPSWREALWEVPRRPRGIAWTWPSGMWDLVRNGYVLLKLDQAFRSGLGRYGLVRGRKPTRPGGS